MKHLPLLTLLLLSASGCGSGDPSPEEASKLKADLSKGGDKNAMSPEAKKNFDAYMKARGIGGGAASAPSAGR